MSPCLFPATITITPRAPPVYDNKQSDSEAPVMLELWEMQSISSLLSLSDLPRPRVVAPDMSQIELFDI